MKKLVYIATAALMCSGLLFTSCKKKETEDNDTEGGRDHALAETCSNDMVNIGMQASYGQGSFNGSSATYKGNDDWNIYNSCAILDFDSLNNTDADTLTVDFGMACAGKDGRTRKGILMFIYTAGKHYRDSGNVITVATPGNTYFVDNNQVIVNSKTISNMGHVTNGYLTWVINSDIKINRSNSNTVTWTATKTKVLLAGEMPNNQPIDWPHAKVGIFGTASGTHTKSGGSSNGFTVTIQQSKWLVRDFTCGTSSRFFVQGVMEFTPSGKPVREINFGTGNCDNQATVTINGHVYNVTLH